MDVIVLPFLLGSLLLAVRRRLFSASCLLAFATGAKIWPVIILPLVLQPKFTSHKVLVAALGIFAVLTAVIFFPLVINSVQDDSGFLAYAEYWEMNDTLFMIFLWASDYFLQTLTEEDGDAQLAARVLVVVLLGIWLVLLVIRQSRVPADLYEKSVWAVAALFLLSPTQFPWYYIWLLPLLAIRPHFSLYLLTPLLFVYYLRFYFQARGNVNLFDYGIVWLEFVPVWLFLVREKFFVGKPISAKAPGGSCIYEK